MNKDKTPIKYWHSFDGHYDLITGILAMDKQFIKDALLDDDLWSDVDFLVEELSELIPHESLSALLNDGEFGKGVIAGILYNHIVNAYLVQDEEDDDED